MTNDERHFTTETLEASIPYWVLLPTLETPAEGRADWAKDVATDIAQREALPETSVEPLTATLEGIAFLDRPATSSWRLLFVADPRDGAAIWDLSFVTPERDIGVAELAGVGPQGGLGEDSGTFAWNGLTGHQSMWFDLDGDAEELERAIVGRARVVVERTLAAGSTILVATSTSSDLQPLTASLIPLQYLLCSDAFAAFVADTTGTPDPAAEQSDRPTDADSSEPGAH